MALAEKRKNSPTNLVLEAVRTMHLPNSVEADMMLSMQYDTAFGIYDHEAKDREDVPWPLLYNSPLEDLARADPLDFRLDQFAENRVFDIFGIPFNELIQFPRADYLKVISSAKKHSAKALGQRGNDISKLENLFRQYGTNAPQPAPRKK